MVSQTCSRRRSLSPLREPLMLTATLSGPADAFEQLILPHRGSLRSRAWRLTGNAADAEDLVQDTLIRAYHYLDALTSVAGIRAWLFTIQLNLFRSQYRRRQSRAAETFSLSLTEEIVGAGAHVGICPSSESAYLEAVRRRAILDAIAELPACYRQVVCLADLEGLSYQEVADQTGVPIGTVRSRLFRARKRLERPLTAWRRP